MIRDTIVIDLDGTLADCTARQHLVMGRHRDYAAFQARLHEDPVHEWCARLMVAFRHTAVIVLVSARPKECHEATFAWLKDRGLRNAFHALYLLRPAGDSTPSLELKRAWLRAYGPERVLFAVDDDQRNARMFRAEGVVCLLCADWRDPEDKNTAHEPELKETQP